MSADTTEINKTLFFRGNSYSNLNWNREYLHWNFGDGTTDTVNFVLHTFPDTLIYKVTLEVKYVNPSNPADFCVQKDSMLVNVSKLPFFNNPHCRLRVNWLYGLTYGVSSYHYGLVEDLFEIVVTNGFNVTIPGGNVPMTGIHTSHQDFFVYTLPMLGDYTFTLHTHYPVPSGSCAYMMAIYGDSIPQTPTDCHASFFMMPDSLNSNNYNLLNFSTGTNLTYLWDFGDGSTSNEVNPVHFFDSTALYTVCLTITDSDGSCSDNYCIKTFGDSTLVGSGARKITVINASGFPINNIDNINIHIYPNPAEYYLNISHDKYFDVVNVKIYDQLGRENIQQMISPNNNSIEINITELYSGIYFIKLSDKNGNLLGTEKFIKK
jgi:hypothetical protein